MNLESGPTDPNEGVACTCGTCPVHGSHGTILVLPDDGADRHTLLRRIKELSSAGPLIGDPVIPQAFPDGDELAKLLEGVGSKAPVNRAQRRAAEAQARRRR